MLNQPEQLGPLHKHDVASVCERLRIGREGARCDDEASSRATRSHDSIEFAHHIDADLESLPLLALHQEVFAPLAQHQVHAAIGLSATLLSNLVALHAECFTHQQLELVPGHSVERVGAIGLRHLTDEAFALLALEEGAKRRHETKQRDNQLANGGNPCNRGAAGECRHLASLDARCAWRGRQPVQEKEARQRKDHTGPPRHHRHDVHEVLGRTLLVSPGHRPLPVLLFLHGTSDLTGFCRELPCVLLMRN